MIACRSKDELEILRKSNVIAAQTLEETRRYVKPGVTTLELEMIARDFVYKKGAELAFKDYCGFPGYICTSVNEEVVHGIPGKRILKEGDILSIDVGIKWKNYYGDTAITIVVGRIEPDIAKLLRVTKEALFRAIAKAHPGNRLSDISFAVQSYVEANGFGVVRDLVGHGIGLNLHEEPQVPNFGPPNKGPELLPGMVLAIEPMVNEGSYKVEIMPDGWTVVTRDRKLSAHFEHTVAITEHGPWILSKI
ncbi:MAG: type I methionyl aminopeptidase [Candidatus Omnitrophica bacterium]|nr:type I methionyl aminopeptidase [Candidatus Omnitrophota bacterium]